MPFTSKPASSTPLTAVKLCEILNDAGLTVIGPAADLSIKLFEEGRISLGRAAGMAGHTKRTFIELLGKRGVSLFTYPPEELDEELRVLERLRGEIEQKHAGASSEDAG